jgi:hypothetical protein
MGGAVTTILLLNGDGISIWGALAGFGIIGLLLLAFWIYDRYFN